MDLSKLSDAELQKMYAQPAKKSVADMSDDELRSAYGGQKTEPKRGVVDKLLGLTGERYQTWPERAVREAVSIPEKAINAAQSGPVGSEEVTRALIEPSAQAAMVAMPTSRAPAIFGAKPKSIASPTQEALESAASKGYTSARESGVAVSPEMVAALQGKIGNELTEQGYVQATAPKTFGVLKEMTPPIPKDGETLGQIGIPAMEAMRRGFRRAGKDYTESDASRRAVNTIDEMLTPLSPELKTARDNSAAAFRAEDVGARLTKAERQAAKSGSGANVDNAIRQKISSILDQKSGPMGYSKDEVAQMERVVRGTNTGNFARVLSKLAPQHPLTGWPASAGGGVAGTALAGPIGGAIGATVPPALGMLAKAIAEGSTQRQAKLDRKSVV